MRTRLAELFLQSRSEMQKTEEMYSKLINRPVGLSYDVVSGWNIWCPMWMLQ